MKRFFYGLAVILLSGAPALWAADKKAPETAAPQFKNFKEAFAAGNQDLKDRKFDEALKDYAAAESLATSPKAKALGSNAQGYTLIKSHKLTEAKAALLRAVESDPNNKLALKNLGIVEYRLYDYGFAGVEELKDSVKNLEASGEDPEQLERAKGDLAREESMASATPTADPSTAGLNFKALLDLADKTQTDGRVDAAMKILKQAAAMAVSPKSKGTAENRQGKLLLDSHRPSESIPFFEAAVKDQPEEKVYWNNLGFGYWILYDSGKGTDADLKKSVDAFYKANAIDASYHSDNLKMALDELKEVDPESAKAFTPKEESEEAANPDAKSEDAKQ